MPWFEYMVLVALLSNYCLDGSLLLLFFGNKVYLTDRSVLKGGIIKED